MAAIMRHELFGVLNALAMTVHLLAERRAKRKGVEPSERAHVERLATRAQEHLERAARIVDAYLDQVQVTAPPEMQGVPVHMTPEQLASLLEQFTADARPAGTFSFSISQAVRESGGIVIDPATLRLLFELMVAWAASTKEPRAPLRFAVEKEADQICFALSPVDNLPEANDLRIFEQRLLERQPALRWLAVARRLAIHAGGSVHLRNQSLELSLPVANGEER